MDTKDELLTSAKKNLDTFGEALGQKLDNVVKVDSTKLDAVKRSFSKTGTLTIPNDVYEKIAEAINNDAKTQKIFKKYSKNEATLIQQVAAQISTLLKSIETQTVTVKEKNSSGKEITVNYTIEYLGAGIGLKNSGIRISKGTSSAFLNFIGDNSAKTAMAQYCVSLYNLGKEVINNTLKECINVFVNGGKDLLKAIYSDAPIDDEIQAVLDKVNAKTKAEVKKKIKASLPKNSSLNDALTKYDNLNTAYKKLEVAVNAQNPTLADVSKARTTFLNVSNKLEKSLKSLGVSLSLNTLADPASEPFYNKEYTEVTIPSGWHGSFGSSKTKIQKIDCSKWTVPTTITYREISEINSTIIGGSAKNTVYGSSGCNDYIIGGKSNDYLCGNDGNDTLVGNNGNDCLKGGYGDDSLVGGKGNDSLYGEYGNDILFGGDGNDTLDGDNGDDTLNGGSGNDKLYGGFGNDYLAGGKNNDTLWGSYGNDKLYGGAGNDTLYGESGDDIFIYKPNEGTDHIMDYQSGDMLKILKKNGNEGGTFSKATFSNDTLTLAISGGGKVIFDGVSAGAQININGQIRTISGNTLK